MRDRDCLVIWFFALLAAVLLSVEAILPIIVHGQRLVVPQSSPNRGCVLVAIVALFSVRSCFFFCSPE